MAFNFGANVLVIEEPLQTMHTVLSPQHFNVPLAKATRLHPHSNANQNPHAIGANTTTLLYSITASNKQQKAGGREGGQARRWASAYLGNGRGYVFKKLRSSTTMQ